VRTSLTVFGIAILLVGGSTLAYLNLAGFDEEHMLQLLRWTAWTAILIYLVVFVARPLQQLKPSALRRKLLKNRRYFGVTLAAVMTVHLVLLLIVNEQPFNIPGAVVFTLMYLMLLTSFDSAPARIGPRNWRWLHKAGLYALGAGYASSIVGRLLKDPTDPVHLTLTLLMLAAIAVRIAAFLKKRQRTEAIDSAR
jgi:DMSO/TMAO reductase YedYZ heme-binding membrane subunit